MGVGGLVAPYTLTLKVNFMPKVSEYIIGSATERAPVVDGDAMLEKLMSPDKFKEITKPIDATINPVRLPAKKVTKRTKPVTKELEDKGYSTVTNLNLPSQRVNFDLGKSGKISAYYHAVIIEDNCIVKKKKKDCTVAHQYEPPILTHLLNLHFNSEVYTVLSAGLNFTCEDIFYTVLVRADKDTLEDDKSQEETSLGFNANYEEM